MDLNEPTTCDNVGQGLALAESQLTPYGKIVEKELLATENRYVGVKIDKYMIMPNHIHTIICIDTYAAGASPCPTMRDNIFFRLLVHIVTK